jgi:hypothetical protein
MLTLHQHSNLKGSIMEIDPSQLRIVRIADLIRQQLQLMRTNRLAKTVSQTDTIVDRLERIAKFRSAQKKAMARNWPVAARRMANQTSAALRDLPHYITEAQRGIEASLTPVPSLRDLCGEMLQLRQEFDGIRYSREKSYLAVTTEQIELHGVYLGDFEIALDISRLARERGSDTFLVLALDPHPAASNSGVTHPHVNNEEICPGDASAAIRSALCAGRVCDAFLMMRSVLLVYNSGSPHVSLENWGGAPCYGCGYTVPDGDVHWCESCEEDFCEECSTCCDRCSKSICSGCSQTCPVCEEIRCRSCMTICPDCSEPICLGCHEDDECPCHDETNEQENNTDGQKEKPSRQTICGTASRNVAASIA